VRQYKECQRRLQKELGVEPDPATTKLLEDIKVRMPVEAVEPGPPAGASSPRPQTNRARRSATGRARTAGRLVVAAAGAAALAAAATAAIILLVRPAPRLVTLAVVPLYARDAKGNGNPILEGTTDALIAELARVPRFSVKSALAVRPYRETAQPTAEIGRSLGVEYLVSGSILRSDGSIRISVHLIDVKDDTTAWAEVYTRDSADVAKAEVEVASRAAEAIRRHFGLE
jgi:TolB-like protein